MEKLLSEFTSWKGKRDKKTSHQETDQVFSAKTRTIFPLPSLKGNDGDVV